MDKKKNLIICRAGDNSLHKQWLEPSNKRNFDILINYYGDEPDKYAADADIYIQSKGVKWSAIYEIIDSMWDKIFEYDAVWFPDDDLSTDAKNINNLFQIFHQANLSLAQPALTKNSYYTHAVTIENSQFVLRLTNFAEVMAPLFSREALRLCWQTFSKSPVGLGLDLIWPTILATHKIAVIDAVPVWHTRPISSGTIYKDTTTDFRDDWKKVMAEYNVKKPYKIRVLGGLVKESNEFNYITSRFELAYRLIIGTPSPVLKRQGFRRCLWGVLFKRLSNK